MMIRSTPAFSVIVETGQVPQAPTRLDVDDAVVVDRLEDDVAAVGLQGGPDRVDRLEDVGFHARAVADITGAPDRRTTFDRCNAQYRRPFSRGASRLPGAVGVSAGDGAPTSAPSAAAACAGRSG